jgi:hypothetical protein
MGRNREELNPDMVWKVWDVYSDAFRDNEKAEKLNAAVPPLEQIALIQTLFSRSDFPADKVVIRECYLASLEEAAGRRQQALARWRALRPTLSPNIWGYVLDRADAAIQRLSAP